MSAFHHRGRFGKKKSLWTAAALVCFHIAAGGGKAASVADLADAIAQAEAAVGCLDFRYLEYHGRATLPDGESREAYCDRYLRGEGLPTLKQTSRCRSFVDFRNGFHLYSFTLPAGRSIVKIVLRDGRYTELHVPPNGDGRATEGFIASAPPPSYRNVATEILQPHQAMYWIGTDNRPLGALLRTSVRATVEPRRVAEWDCLRLSFAAEDTLWEENGRPATSVRRYDICAATQLGLLPVRRDRYLTVLPAEFSGPGPFPVIAGDKGLSEQEARKDVLRRMKEANVRPEHYEFRGHDAFLRPECHPDRHKRSVLSSSVLCRDFRKLPSGAYAPFVIGSLGFSGEGVTITELRLESCAVNEDPDRLHETWSAPVGATIDDRRTGIVYREGLSPESYPEEARKHVEKVRGYQRGEVELPSLRDGPAPISSAGDTGAGTDRAACRSTAVRRHALVASAILALAGIAVFLRRRRLRK